MSETRQETIFAIPSVLERGPWCGRRIYRTVQDVTVGDAPPPTMIPVQADLPPMLADTTVEPATIEMQADAPVTVTEREIVESEPGIPGPFDGCTWTACDEKTFLAAIAKIQKTWGDPSTTALDTYYPGDWRTV